MVISEEGQPILVDWCLGQFAIIPNDRYIKNRNAKADKMNTISDNVNLEEAIEYALHGKLSDHGMSFIVPALYAQLYDRWNNEINPNICANLMARELGSRNVTKYCMSRQLAKVKMDLWIPYALAEIQASCLIVAAKFDKLTDQQEHTRKTMAAAWIKTFP
jgi:hypothetical protein